MRTVKLTPKQKKFVSEYLVDLNATQAAIRAGYSKQNADKIGPELLGKTRVAEAIQRAQERRSHRTEITADRVLQELAYLGFANMLDYVTIQPDGSAVVDLSKLTREQAAAIQEVIVDEYTDGRGEDARPVKRVKVKLADKRANLELIGKHLGMFVEKREITGKDGKPLISFADFMRAALSDGDTSGEAGSAPVS